jgi:L-cysteine:1D-myo-inositol 2-amino-2-deoxy-alpha-D-glucopyranoside ligase
LDAWVAASTGGGNGEDVLNAVRERLDDDLDTPGALAVIDAAAGGGVDVTDAAGLLGVRLDAR